MAGPLTVWRVVSPAYRESAYSGAGALEHGGRFNSPGRPCVYASESLALSMLEVLAYAGAFRLLQGRLAVAATFEDPDVETMDVRQLPKGWDALPYSAISQRTGDEWLESQRTLLLRVPSVVVPYEYNVLINPRHPRAASMQIVAPVVVPVDARLLTAPG